MARLKSKSKSKQTYYRQCTMHSPTESGYTTQTAWIPENFAEEGRKIHLGKRTDPDFERIWTVQQVPDQRVLGEYIEAHERDHLTQREGSDI